MIAIDTSSLVAYLAGDRGRDVEALDAALARNWVYLPPVVVSEALTARNLTAEVERLILGLPQLAITEGYWERAGRLRRAVVAHGLRAALADTLICQSCLDHDVALITRDDDFRHFVRYGGLRLG